MLGIQGLTKKVRENVLLKKIMNLLSLVIEIESFENKKLQRNHIQKDKITKNYKIKYLIGKIK
jgi:hypothetical protein